MMLKVATETIRLEYEEAADTEEAIEVRLSGQNGAGWQRTLTSAITATPILLLPPDRDRVLLACGFDLYALDIHTGEIKWQKTFSEPIWTGRLLPDGRLLLHLELSVACLDGSGEESWIYHHDEIVTEVDLQGNRVMIRDLAERRLKLDSKTGGLAT